MRKIFKNLTSKFKFLENCFTKKSNLIGQQPAENLKTQTWTLLDLGQGYGEFSDGRHGHGKI